MMRLRVGASRQADCRTVNEAIAKAAGGGAEIVIEPGLYEEKVFIAQPGIRLLGAGPQAALLRYGDGARHTGPDGQPLGTFKSYTLLVYGDDFYAEGLTIENSAGPGARAGQAVAAHVDADRAVFKNCAFIGAQDTLFTGPLPLKPRQTPFFGAPFETPPPRRPCRQYYENCLITGDVDFIFGGACAYFYRCRLIGRRGGGYMAAPSTPQGQKHGYIFYECRIEGESSQQQADFYLARPWRSWAKAAFVCCYLGSCIKPEGWHDWDSAEARARAEFIECANNGPGAGLARRQAWARQEPAEHALQWSREAVLGMWRPYA